MHVRFRRSSRVLTLSTTIVAMAVLGLSACDSTPHPAAIGGAAPTSLHPSAPPATTGGPITSATRTSGPALGGAAASAPAASHKLGAQPDKPFLDEGDLTAKEPSASNDQHVYGNVFPTDGLSLDSGWFRPTNRWSYQTVPPPTIETGVAKRAEVFGYRPGMIFTYRIIDEAGKPTNYWVGAWFYEPAVRPAEWECKIYVGGDPRTDGVPTALAPYACTWGNEHGWDPHPGLTVSKATVVTNKAQAKELLTKYCNAPTGARDCAFVNFGYGTALGPVVIASDIVHNSQKLHGDYTVRWADERSEENSIGVELGNEVKIWDVWKISLTLKYDHKWETSHKFEQELKTDIEGEGVAWYTHAALMQTTVGTWVVNAGDKRYSIPGVSLSTPAEAGGLLEIHGCKWTNFNMQDKSCVDGETTKLVPLQ